MTRGDMRTMVRIFLGETSADGYPDAEINTVLNSSQLKVAGETTSNLTYEEFETVAGTERYPLPNDFLQLVDLQVSNGSNRWSLERVSYDQYQDAAITSYQGLPRFYRIEFGAVSLTNTSPGDLWIRPIPDAVYTGRIVFRQKPTPMSDDSDTTELPEIAHMAVCYHAAMVLSRKFRDRALITELAALWGQELDMVRKVLLQSDMTGPGHVRNLYR